MMQGRSKACQRADPGRPESGMLARNLSQRETSPIVGAEHPCPSATDHSADQGGTGSCIEDAFAENRPQRMEGTGAGQAHCV